MGIVSSTGGGSATASPLNLPEGAERAVFAAGCFWGVEHIFRKHYDNKGLYDARVGYIGGEKNNPSYRAVCSGSTGHAEATLLAYDPTKISFKELCEFFYKIHDPTTLNQQGGDRGSQYRSGIFYFNQEQKNIAEQVTKAANSQWYSGKIKTEVVQAGQWWDAETYHQLYLDKNPGGYQCASHYVRSLGPLKYDS